MKEIGRNLNKSEQSDLRKNKVVDVAELLALAL